MPDQLAASGPLFGSPTDRARRTVAKPRPKAAPTAYVAATATSPKPAPRAPRPSAAGGDPLHDERRCQQLPSLDRVEGEEHRARQRFEDHADSEEDQRRAPLGIEVEREADQDRQDTQRRGQRQLERKEIEEEAVECAPVPSDLHEQQVVEPDADRQCRDLTEGEGEYEQADLRGAEGTSHGREKH